MSTNKKLKQAEQTDHNSTVYTPPFSVCRLAYPFVALSITKSPALWSERLLFDNGTGILWISGPDIELPLFENEYRVECGEYGNKTFRDFLLYMDSLSSFRLFRFAGCNDLFFCTDADEMTVNVALAFARQFSD